MQPRLVFGVNFLAALCLMSAGCASVARPEATVEHFVQAFNEKDLNVMLSCVDPKQERMLRASLRVVEKLSGGRLAAEDLLEMIPGLYQMIQSQVSEDINFRDLDVGRGQISGENAEVPVSLTVLTRSRGLENARQKQFLFVLRQFDEGWRIVGIRNK